MPLALGVVEFKVTAPLARSRSIRLALVAVDHDSTRGGDAIADHWGCAYRVEAGRLWMTDPATARIESVDWETLAGPVRWGRFLRPYQVVRVVTVWR